MKEDTRVEGPWEYGEWEESKGQGTRSDISEAVDLAVSEGMRAVAFKLPTAYVKYHKGLQALLDARVDARGDDDLPIVHCYWGRSGAGKTRSAMKDLRALGLGKVFKKTSTMDRWWDGYNSEACVVIDEADKGYLKLADFLALLDPGELLVSVKGTSRQFKGMHIICTSNKHPKDWYPNVTPDERAGMVRRFTSIVHMDGGHPGIQEDPVAKCPTSIDDPLAYI